MADLEWDRLDYLEENDPKAYAEEMRTRAARHGDAQRRREGRPAPFPPAPLPEGQHGVILLSGYSHVEMPVNSGWVVEGGFRNK